MTCLVVLSAVGCNGTALNDATSPDPAADTGAGAGFGPDGRARAVVARALLVHAHLLADGARDARREAPPIELAGALAANADDLAAALAPYVEPADAEAFRAAWSADNLFLLGAVTNDDPGAVAESAALDQSCAATIATLGLDPLSGTAATGALCDQRRAVLAATVALDDRPGEATGLFVGAGRVGLQLADALTPRISPAEELLVGVTALLTEHVLLVTQRSRLEGVEEPLGPHDAALEQNAAALQRRLVVAVGEGDDFEDRWAELVASYEGTDAGETDAGAVLDAHQGLAEYLRGVLAGHTGAQIEAGLWPYGDRLVPALEAAREASPLAPVLQRAAIEESGDAAIFLASSITRQFPDEF